MSHDAYPEVLQAQNVGIPCRFCGSPSGHRVHCGLLNRNAGEAQRSITSIADLVEKGLVTLSEDDNKLLYALGVRW